MQLNYSFGTLAALLCEDCGKKVKDAREAITPSWNCRHGQRVYRCLDSECMPQGPYPDGGGEADSPQHCDHCNVFLENPLTTDGGNYVKHIFDTYPGHEVKAWKEFYSHLFTG